MKELVKAGESSGFSKDQIKRAKNKLRIKSDRDGFGKGSVVYWDLPVINDIESEKNTIGSIGSAQNSMHSMRSMEEIALYDNAQIMRF